MKEKKTKESLRKTLDNFFYHYKFHVIFGLFLLIVVGSIVHTIIEGQIERVREANRPPADLEMLILGDYRLEDDLSSLEEKIKQQFPDWETVDIEMEYSPSEPRSPEDIAAMQKSIVILQTSEPDIYLFDRHQFHKLIESGPFLKLDSLMNNSQNDSQDESRFQYYQQEEDEEPHIYGLNVADHDLFASLGIENKDLIAAVRVDTNNKENALRFLEQISKDLGKEP